MKDIIEGPDDANKDTMASTMAQYAHCPLRVGRRSPSSGDPNISITPIWIRGDGSIPWEHPPLAETEEAMRQAAEDTAQAFLEADATDLAREFQDGVRKSARTAARWTWEALGNFAEHQAPPVMDAVEIALREEAGADAKTAQERRCAKLAREAAETTEAKNNPRDWIVREMRPHLAELRKRLRTAVNIRVWAPLPADNPPDAVAAAKDADNLLADYLESELNGPTIATQIRDSIDERQAQAKQHDTDGAEEQGRAWRLWFRPEGNPPIGPFPFLTLLAIAVWRDVVRPTLEEERRAQKLAAKHVAGLTLDLFGSVADRHRKSRGLEVTAEGFKTIDDDGQPVHLADLPAEVPLKLLEGAPRALAAIHTYDMAVWAITQGAREHWARPQQGESGRWRFHGGKHVAALVQGLETIDRPNQVARKEIPPDVARAYEKATVALMVPFPDPHKPGGVLSLAGGSYAPGRGRRPAIISFDLAGWALPGDVYDRMGGGHNARARAMGKIVPLPTGRPKLLAQRYKNREGEALIGSIAGPSAWFYARTVGAIRIRAADVARGYGAHLPRRKLAELARQAGLDPKWLDALLDLWLDGDDGPADLEKMGKDRYHVGPRHWTARLNIDQEGRKEADGAKGKPPARKRGKSKKN